ncbi:aldehyde dehydrogenase family protein [Methanogenium organophilum]|uniref:Aldehyde dehydrogenase family protein n=1 Tax=Methanogenium organophilum TaxID=2199 RepID=A0A9X9S649_METOG|nr:aldehyde dehydrogenase family protein [Methanogenium organophilum]WAI02417.1 aldehyde dehydrogenase family protein [Methanogenium organophilum]
MQDPEPFLVGGEWRTSPAVLDVAEPYLGSTVASVCIAGREDCNDALNAAEAGYKQMRDLPAYRRSECLTAMAGFLEEHAEAATELIVSEAGKPWRAAESEVMRSSDTLRVCAEEARRIDGEILPLDWTEGGDGRTGYLYRVPLGIILGITPFNFPLNLACHKLGPALAAGNACILKPASKTPLTSLFLGEAALAAGIPPQAVSVLPCLPETAEAMVRDPRVAMVSFTGSPEVGWHLQAVARTPRVALELGGNAAVIVHEDADLAYAAARIAHGAFSYSGQACISVQRVLVHHTVYEEMRLLLCERAASLVTGDPTAPETDVGPMISEFAAMAAEKKIAEAVAAGAVCCTGGSREGAVLQPTVLENTTPGMDVNATELFAPGITLIPYDTWEEAIALAADTPYGLQAGIFTNDIVRIQKAVRGIPVGGLIVNDIPTFRMDHMPYGGTKHSGIGREGPRSAIREMTEERLVVVNGQGGR